MLTQEGNGTANVSPGSVGALNEHESGAVPPTRMVNSVYKLTRGKLYFLRTQSKQW